MCPIFPQTLQIAVHGLITSHHYCVGTKPALATVQYVRKLDSYWWVLSSCYICIFVSTKKCKPLSDCAG